VRQGGEWVINGEKVYISGVRESLAMGGVHLLLARTEPDPAAGHRAFTFFALPLKGTPGIMPTYFKDMGRMGISTGGFAMTDVRLPGKHQVGDLNRGFYHAMEGFSAARVLIGATCVGASEAVLDLGVEHIKQRQAFGRPLASYEGISFPMADHYANLESTRLLVYKAAWIMDQKYGAGTAGHSDIALAAALAKLRAPKMGLDLMNEVADWFWGDGLHKRVPGRDGDPRHPLLLDRRRGDHEYHAAGHQPRAARARIFALPQLIPRVYPKTAGRVPMPGRSAADAANRRHGSRLC